MCYTANPFYNLTCNTIHTSISMFLKNDIALINNKHHIQRCDGLAYRYFRYFQLAWKYLHLLSLIPESQDFGVFKGSP